MEILNYTPKHEDFRQRLKAFCETDVIPRVDRWEEDHIVPKSIWRKMGAGGFLCPTVDPAYGGLGGDFRYSVIVTEELSRTAHTGLAAALHSDVVVPYIETYGSEALKQKYLPGCVSGECITAVGMTEPDAGSDLAGMKTTAEEEGDIVVVNGSKTFISNGINCDLLVFAAKDPAVENKYEAVSLYVVEDGTQGFTRGRKLDKMGWHSQDTAELFFSNCRIPVGNRLGEKGMGFLMLMEKLQQERLTCALGAVCGAERILEWAMDFCRKNNRGGRPLSKSQAVQFELVEMAADVKVGRTFVDKLVADHIEKKNIVIETSMAKFWTTDLANRTADRALSILGNFGTVESCPLVRAWRDVRVMSIFAGTNEIMKGIAAKFMGL
ncbi:acyl-CoA dehydrogenase family protein [uncultured Desulfosarcina sp.]|uniref:acyl-CoA dehydrogenase family protein n=1 Tax=uncultured Desulfosarcina sp. TaxID=218289 RepID=UPI0029C6489A|nr:acyl-CoA dehydrogenase family protein [uncultured Desulfosarcina sp.]